MSERQLYRLRVVATCIILVPFLAIAAAALGFFHLGLIIVLAWVVLVVVAALLGIWS